MRRKRLKKHKKRALLQKGPSYFNQRYLKLRQIVVKPRLVHNESTLF